MLTEEKLICGTINEIKKWISENLKIKPKNECTEIGDKCWAFDENIDDTLENIAYINKPPFGMLFWLEVVENNTNSQVDHKFEILHHEVKTQKIFIREK